jgi:hypothetical protein
MVKWKLLWPAVGLMVVVGSRSAYAQDDRVIWKEFVGALKSGTLTVDEIRPL